MFQPHDADVGQLRAALLLQSNLDVYLGLYAPLFQRREQVASARRYLQGLLCDEPRKSAERMVLKL